MRCEHGFEREIVRCVTCDGGYHEPEPKLRAPSVGVGSVIGGAVVLSVWRRYAMTCRCACGEQFCRSRTTLRKALHDGTAVTCPACKGKAGST